MTPEQLAVKLACEMASCVVIRPGITRYDLFGDNSTPDADEDVHIVALRLAIDEEWIARQIESVDGIGRIERYYPGANPLAYKCQLPTTDEGDGRLL